MPAITKPISAKIPMMPKSQLATFVRIPLTNPGLDGSPVSVGISIPFPGEGVGVGVEVGATYCGQVEIVEHATDFNTKPSGQASTAEVMSLQSFLSLHEQHQGTVGSAHTSPLQKTPNPKTATVTKNIFVLFCIFFKFKKTFVREAYFLPQKLLPYRKWPR